MTHPRRARVALATAAAVPDLDEDERLVLAPLSEHGIEAVPAIWDDPAVDWGAFDVVAVRATWDYPARLDDFLAWAAAVAARTRLCNALDVLRWNTDKRYLRDLDAAGVPIVPTTVLDPGDDAGPALDAAADTAREVVVKPSVSAGSKDTARYALPEDRGAAEAHAHRLHDADRAVLVQPYVGTVDAAGEAALVHLGGAFSHAARKGPILRRGMEPVTGLFAEEDMAPRRASDAERAVADAALGAVPGGAGSLLYARVDLVELPDVGPVVLEVELTEPSLFLRLDPEAPARFAGAVAAAVRTGSSAGP